VTVALPRTRRLVATGALLLAGATGLVALPSPASAADCPALRSSVTVDRGDRGEAVRAVQCVLRVALGDEYADLAVDGAFGPQTHRAVTTFQQRSGLAPDGIVGPRTYEAFEGSEPRPDGDSVAYGPTLRRGDTGGHVRVLQEALGVSADGVFGPVTERSVRAFQAREGLAVDGIVGPRTRTALAEHGVDGF
jgi:peptidoglycan hydrolase-like protein with peptidoglycan-binding domain